MRLALPVVMALAAPAAADPCHVRVLRAPDDVRTVVVRWVDAEDSCSVDLTVRIIPTTGGLYVLAHGDDGKDRERIVPDAESAGVLIASWAADDSMPDDPDPIVHDEDGVWDDPAFTPPEPSREVHISIRPVESAPEPPPRGRLLALSGSLTTGARAGGSARLDLELTRAELGTWGSISLGVTGAVGRSNGPVLANDTMGLVPAVPSTGYPSLGVADIRDLTGMLFAAFTVHPGRWHLRLQVGMGSMSTHADLQLSDPRTFMPAGFTAEGSSGIGEIGGWVTHDLGTRWRLGAGLVSASFSESLPIEGTYTTLDRHDEVTTLLATLQREL